MKNSISVSGLSEFANEVKQAPEQAHMQYGVSLKWESGTRSCITTKPMKVGKHVVNRAFSWKVDEPRQLLGSNHAANPQEYLLSGFAACMMMAFVAGATARGIQLDSLSIDVQGDLDLRGFLGVESDAPVGFPTIRYLVSVRGDATEQEFQELLQQAEKHSPNAMTLANPVILEGKLNSGGVDKQLKDVAA